MKKEIDLESDIKSILKKYSYLSEIVKNAQYPIRSISIKPLTNEITEGIQYSYDSGYNYFSSIKNINGVYIEHFDTWHQEKDRDTEIILYVPEEIDKSSDEIKKWKRKYPFLESIINNCSNLFLIMEENVQRNKDLNWCKINGYDKTSGESTSWEWYGVRNGKLKMLEGRLLGDVMIKETFDYMITCEHIKSDIFEDDTIRIYNLTGERL
jgi:hypothetical protein